MRIRRHCYDKPHRCPGWAGGGRRYPKPGKTVCKNGSLRWDMYEQRFWRFRFHRCAKCGTVAVPIVVKYLDPFYWVDWELGHVIRNWKYRRDDRNLSRQRHEED